MAARQRLVSSHLERLWPHLSLIPFLIAAVDVAHGKQSEQDRALRDLQKKGMSERD